MMRLKTTYSLLATCAVLAAMPGTAHAAMVLFTGDPQTSIVTKKSGADFITNAQVGNVAGAGDVILSLNATPGSLAFESGSIAANPNGTANVTGDARLGTGNSVNSRLATVATLGWTDPTTGLASGSQVGVGFAPNQTGGSGITLQSLALTLFPTTGNQSNALGSFNLATPITYPSTTGLTGQAKNVSLFELSPEEQATFNTIVAANGGASGVLVGLSFSAGCSTSPPAAGCLVANDGTEEFVNAPTGLVEPVVPPVPEIPLPAGLPLFATGLACMGLLGWRSKRKSSTTMLAT